MVANRLVGSGCNVICFSIAWLGSESFLACYGIPHFVHLCLDCVSGCSIDLILHWKGHVRFVLIYDSVLSF